MTTYYTPINTIVNRYPAYEAFILNSGDGLSDSVLYVCKTQVDLLDLLSMIAHSNPDWFDMDEANTHEEGEYALVTRVKRSSQRTKNLASKKAKTAKSMMDYIDNLFKEKVSKMHALQIPEHSVEIMENEQNNSSFVVNIRCHDKKDKDLLQKILLPLHTVVDFHKVNEEQKGSKKIYNLILKPKDNRLTVSTMEDLYYQCLGLFTTQNALGITSRSERKKSSNKC